MSSRCSFECFEKPGELEPYADIGGPGVVIGFLGTAWFVVALVSLYYFLGFDPTKSPFQSPTRQNSVFDNHPWRPNHIDQLVLKWSGAVGDQCFGRLKTSRGYEWLTKRPRWESALTRVLLSMCDVQLLTGIGILLSGYLDLFCFISAYHWQLIVYLAWFSNLTHSACLIVLRGYLHQRQLERNWRLLCMTFLWLGLITAMVPTAFFNWVNFEPTAALAASNARCFFDIHVGRALFNDTFCSNTVNGTRINGNGEADYCGLRKFSETSALQSSVVSILLLGFSYCTRSVKLIKSFSDRVRLSIRHTLSQWFTTKLVAVTQRNARGSDASARKKLVREVYIKSMTAVYLVGKLYADLLTSDVSDVYWLVVSAVWGTIRLTETRSSAVVDDNEWGFGQILPVFLLIGPIIVAIESIAPEGQPIQSDNDSRQPQGEGTARNNGAAVVSDSNSQTIPPVVERELRSQQSDLHGSDISTRHSSASSSIRTARQTEQNNTTATSDPLETEQMDTRATLQAHYIGSSWMLSAVLLACIQVIPATVMIFTNISKQKMSPIQLMFSFMTNVLFTQPFNCFVLIFFGLTVGQSLSIKFKDFEIGQQVVTALLLMGDIMALVFIEFGFDVLFTLGIGALCFSLSIWRRSHSVLVEVSH